MPEPGSLSQNVHNCTIALHYTLLRSYQATGYSVYRGHSHIRIYNTSLIFQPCEDKMRRVYIKVFNVRCIVVAARYLHVAVLIIALPGTLSIMCWR